MVKLHGRTIPAVNLVYLSNNIRATLTKFEADVTEYRRIVREYEERVTRRELEQRMEAERDNVPPLLVSETFGR